MRDSTKKRQTEITIEGFSSKGSPDTVIVAGHGSNLLETLVNQDVEIATSCGGQGTCGTCRVFVLDGGVNLNSPTEIEIEMAQDRKFAANERLSCQCAVSGSIRLRIPGV